MSVGYQLTARVACVRIMCMRPRSQRWVILIVTFINVSLTRASAAQTSNERENKRTIIPFRAELIRGAA